MASRYWVGGTASWANTAAQWAATSGGAGGAGVPTAADDVFFDATSGAAAVTIQSGVAANARSINCTGFTGSWIFPATASVINIGDASGGALTLSSTMTVTLTAVGTINFISTSSNGGTGWSITTAGKTLPNVVFNGVGGKWVQADAMTCSGNFTLTNGTFTTGSNFSLSCVIFSSNNGNVRTLTLGSSTVTVTSATAAAFDLTATTNMTITANTAVATLTAGSFVCGSGSAGFLNGLSLVMSGAGSPTINCATATFTNFTRTGTVAKTDGLTLANPLNVTGTLTLTGNSLTSRLLILSSVVGTARTITAAAVSLTNVDIMDIAGAGAAAPFTGTSLGDCQGNSGITFPAGVTRYGVVAGNWSSTATWSATSGGAGGASVPLPQDDVRFDANSAAGTYSGDMPRLGRNIDFTGFTRTYQPLVAPTSYGNITLASGMTFTSGQGHILAGRGSQTIQHNGKAWGNVFIVTAPGGTYTLLDACTTASTNSGPTITAGTFTTTGFAVTAFSFAASGGTTTNLGTSTISLTGGGWTVNALVAALSAASSVIVLSTALATVRTFAGGGLAYGTLTYTVANSPGGLTITGANTFVTLNVGSGRTLTLPSSTTNTVTNWNVVGQNNGYVYLPGSAGNYMSTPNVTALQVTGDIDLRVRVAADNFAAPGSAATLISKDSGSAGTRMFTFRFANAVLALDVSTNGSTTVNTASTAAPSGTVNGQPVWLRVTRRQSDGRVQFFQASGSILNPVASDFTQIGTDVINSAGSAMFNGTAPVEVGTFGATNGLAGKFYRAQMRNGIDGTLVFDADLVNKTFGANTFVESSSQAATVTLNGTAPVGDGRIFLNSSTGGTAAILLSDGPQILSAYLKIQDVAAGIVPAWDVSNLLPTDTSTLEGSIGNWVASTGCTIARSTADFRDGAASLLLTPTTTGPKATNDATKIAITLGTLYVVSAYVKAATAGATMAVYPYFWNSTPIYLADGVAVSRTDVTTAWTRIINGFVPSGTQAYASPAVNGVAVVGQAHYYDDIAMAATTPAYAGATSLSVSNTTGWLFTDMAVGAQIGTPWPVRTPVGAQRQGLWPARAVTGQSCQAVWPVRTAVGQQRQGLWPVRTPVASQRQGLWSVRATVASQRQALWPVRVVTSAQRAAVWPVRMLVHGDRQLAWPVRAAVGSQRAAAWPVRTSVGAQRSTPWPVRTVISAQRAAVWPVRAKVGQQRQALWPARTPVGSQRQALWLLLTNVRSDRQASWPVRSVVGAQRQAVWSARALVTGQRQARWPVRVPVAKQAVIAWPIHSPVTRSLQASWLLTARVASQRQVVWPLAAVVGKQTDLAWGVRVTVRNSRAVAWPITTRVTAECVLEWTMVISVGRTLAVRWPTRRTVGRDLMSMWSLGHLVACQLALVWRIFFGPHRDVDITVAAPELGWTFDSPVLETAVGLPSVETVST